MPKTFSLHAEGGLALTLMDRGATWMSCSVPLPDGSRRSVVLGCPSPEAYARQGAYLGATVGRYANRIGGARIAHAGREWQLTPNPGSRHQLHGGPEGFHARDWSASQAGPREIAFSLASREGDQGFPGTLRTTVIYRLPDPMTLEIETLAEASAPTPVCITNHAYFNLDGRLGDARQQRLHIAAQHYLPVDAELIPLGPLAPVQGTGFDFTQPKPLAADWLRDEQQRAGAGYDHAFLLEAGCHGMNRPAAELQSSDGRLLMQLFTTLPALQLYAGQHLAGIPSHDGTPYGPCPGLALEPQFLPDSPHHPEWPQPSCWLLPGQTYRHFMCYRFVAN
jgi:aldose 1-epimerase